MKIEMFIWNFKKLQGGKKVHDTARPTLIFFAVFEDTLIAKANIGSLVLPSTCLIPGSVWYRVDNSSAPLNADSIDSWAPCGTTGAC